jgi:hypothetical protein
MMNCVFPRIELLVTNGAAALAMGAVPAEAPTGPQTNSLVLRQPSKNRECPASRRAMWKRDLRIGSPRQSVRRSS